MFVKIITIRVFWFVSVVINKAFSLYASGIYHDFALNFIDWSMFDRFFK